MTSSSGFTLLEILITILSIILITILTIPFLQNFFIDQQGRNSLASLELHLRHSREQAIYLQIPVTMCPSTDKMTCSRDWNKSIIIFTDRNKNNRIDGDDRLLREISPAKEGEIRHFTGRYIRFNSNGFAGFNTGSLSYCSDATARITGVFIISRVGRIRRGIDSTGDGIKQLANGQNAPCQ